MIDDVMLPATGGEVTLVVSVGGFLGIGAKLVKVPFSSVRLMPDKMMMMQNGGKASLMGMPKYSYGFGGGG